jgi:hypothetical protein
MSEGLSHISGELLMAQTPKFGDESTDLHLVRLRLLYHRPTLLIGLAMENFDTADS